MGVGRCVMCFGILVFLVSLGFPLLFSQFAGGWTCAKLSSFRPQDLPRLDGKIFMVTGATTGIGRVTAYELARKGAHVIVHGRSPAKTDPVVAAIKKDGGSAEAVIADLTSLGAVAEMSKSLASRHVDVLVCNAGLCKDCMGKTADGFEMTKDGFELHIQVNHLAHQLLVERLIASGVLGKQSRLVMVSSGLEFSSYPEGMRFENWQTRGVSYTDGSAYGQSKLANIMVAHEVQKRFEIKSISLHPGIIETDLSRYRKEKSASANLVTMAMRQVISMVRMSTEDGALNQLWAAGMPEAESGYYTPVAKKVNPTHAAFTPENSAKCWEHSHQLLLPFLS